MSGGVGAQPHGGQPDQRHGVHLPGAGQERGRLRLGGQRLGDPGRQAGHPGQLYGDPGRGDGAKVGHPYQTLQDHQRGQPAGRPRRERVDQRHVVHVLRQTRYSDPGTSGYSWTEVWSKVSGDRALGYAAVRRRCPGTSLTNGSRTCTAYTFEVRAKNGVGYGSAASASATPAGKPGTPGSFSATRGDGEVSLSWDAAAAKGSAIQYYQTRYSSNAGHTWSNWSKVSGGKSASQPHRGQPDQRI